MGSTMVCLPNKTLAMPHNKTQDYIPPTRTSENSNVYAKSRLDHHVIQAAQFSDDDEACWTKI